MNIAGCLSALCVVASASAAPQSAPGDSVSAGVPSALGESSELSSEPHALPAGTVIELELAEPVGSSRQHRGDKFRIRVAEAVLRDGSVLIPLGTTGIGEVVHAAPSGAGGKAGELILAARSLDLHGRSIALRGMKLGGSGKDTSKVAVAVAVAIGPIAMFVHGRELEIPAGARAHAKLASDFSPDAVPVEAAPSTAIATSWSSTGNATGIAPEPFPTPDPDNQE